MFIRLEVDFESCHMHHRWYFWHIFNYTTVAYSFTLNVWNGSEHASILGNFKDISHHYLDHCI